MHQLILSLRYVKSFLLLIFHHWIFSQTLKTFSTDELLFPRVSTEEKIKYQAYEWKKNQY